MENNNNDKSISLNPPPPPPAFGTDKKALLAHVRERLRPQFIAPKRAVSNLYDETESLIRSLGMDPRDGTPRQVFGEDFVVCNHMSRCQIVNVHDRDFIFPLTCLNCPEAGWFYLEGDTPSLTMLQITKGTATALFSKNGYVTLSGGNSYESVEYTMMMCCYLLLKALRTITPGEIFTVVDFKLCTKVASTKLVQQKICMHEFVDAVRHYKIPNNRKLQHEIMSMDLPQFPIKYNEDVISLAYIKPLVQLIPNLHVNVSPQGGLVFFGFRYTHELVCASYVMAYLLSPHRIPLYTTNDALYKYNTQRRLQKESKVNTKQRQKAKKLQLWRQKMLNSRAAPVNIDDHTIGF